MLEGYVRLQGDAVSGGAIRRLRIDGQVLTNLRIAGGSFERVGGRGRVVMQLEERSAGLHARLPGGNAIRQLEIRWPPGGDPAQGIAVATVAGDFAMVRDAVAAMQQQTSDALAAAPMRRAALMPALFAALGADPINWCCLDDTAMPAAALEP
jgi:hypothetical protein